MPGEPLKMSPEFQRGSSMCGTPTWPVVASFGPLTSWRKRHRLPLTKEEALPKSGLVRGGTSIQPKPARPRAQALPSLQEGSPQANVQ